MSGQFQDPEYSHDPEYLDHPTYILELENTLIGLCEKYGDIVGKDSQ